MCICVCKYVCVYAYMYVCVCVLCVNRDYYMEILGPSWRAKRFQVSEKLPLLS